MKEDLTDKPDLDQLFEKARNAEPALSLEEAESLVAMKGEGHRIEQRKKAVKKNVFTMLTVAGLLFIFFAGFLLNQKSVKENKTNQVAPKDKVEETKQPGEIQPIIVAPSEEDNRSTDFPPAYPEENISKPDLPSKPVNKPAFVSEKISMQAPGEATVTFVHDDKNVKLVLLFDDVKDLYIDDVKIDPANYNDYKDIVAEGKKLELDARKNKENSLNKSGRDQQRQNEIILNSIIIALARDELVPEGESFDFRLQWNKLLLNDKLQPKEVYEKYKALYEEASGKLLTQNSNIHIKH